MVVKKEIPRHRVFREILRHYLELQDLFRNEGKHVIHHGYYVEDEDGVKRKVEVAISLWDLQDSLKKLAPRKKEAVFYNVILDKKQKDVAEIMGITTVSVGQYVDQACIQLAEEYFADEIVEAEYELVE